MYGAWASLPAAGRNGLRLPRAASTRSRMASTMAPDSKIVSPSISIAGTLPTGLRASHSGLKR